MACRLSIRTLSRPLLWAVLALLVLSHPLAAQEIIRVDRVIDGDTIVLENGDRVRYIGIDTPEVRQRRGRRWIYAPEPFAEAASKANRRLVAGQPVRLEMDAQRHDRYGRRLAYVYLGDVMVNELLVRRGLAHAREYPPNLRYRKRFKAAQAEARRAGRGLWGDSRR